MVLIIAIALSLFVLALNIGAVYASTLGSSSVFVVAKYAGNCGVLMVCAVLITVFDAFTQIWVARPGYDGLPVFYSLLGLGIATSISGATAIYITYLRYSKGLTNCSGVSPHTLSQ